MNILFRTDSSSLIGTGHVMRDLVLAKEFKNSTTFFATQNLTGNINSFIEKSGYKIKNLISNNQKEFSKLVQKLKIDLVIIDHYEIDYKYEKKLKKENPKIKILVLDDTYEKHHCDILLNHNISANKIKYKGLIPSSCELRCGSKYTLLRDEFKKQKKKEYKKNTKKTLVFIAMGGADHSNINEAILKNLKDFSKLDIHMVTTHANKNLSSLEKYVKNKKNITLHINSNKIAKLIKKSDFAIVTPSVTVNEVYYLEVPFIAIKTAKNQEDIYEYLKNKNYLTLNKFDKLLLLELVKKMMKKINK